jgi:hypothetical protein
MYVGMYNEIFSFILTKDKANAIFIHTYLHTEPPKAPNLGTIALKPL